MSILVLPKRQIYLPKAAARIYWASPLTNKLALAYSTTENGGALLFDTGKRSLRSTGANLPSPAWVASGTNHFGYVPSFSGTAAFTSAATTAPILSTTNGYTIAAWYYRTSSSGTVSSRIITLDDNVNTTSFITSLMFDSPTNNHMALYQKAATTDGDRGALASMDTLNKWFFIAVTFNGTSTFALYGGDLSSFYGDVTGTTPNVAPVGAITNTSQRIIIGNRADGARPWLGQLGPVMGWERLLSLAEMEQLCLQPGSLWAPTPANRRYWIGTGNIPFNLQANMRGMGSEQLKPNLNISFSGNLDGYGKEQLTPGKTYNGVSANLDGKGNESFTPAKSYSFLGNFLGKGGETFTPGKAFGLAANLDGLGKISGTVAKSLGVRLDAVGRGLLSGMPQLVSGVQYILSGNFRGRGDTQLTPTQSLQMSANMRGQAGEKLTPTLTSQLKGIFLGKGDLDGRLQLTSGVQKILSASMVGMGRLVGTLTQSKQVGSNLDGRGDLAAQPGKTSQAGANFRGLGDLKATPARQGNLSANMQGKAREVFTPGKAAQLSANLDGTGKFSGIAQRTGFAKAVMVGRGWLKAFFNPTTPTVLDYPVTATIQRTPNPAAVIIQNLKPGAVIAQTALPVGVIARATSNPSAVITESLKPGSGINQTVLIVGAITRTDYPAQIVQSSRPAAKITKD